MQKLQQIFNSEESKQKDFILEILADKYFRPILRSITNMPKSAIEITSETKIPMSTVYRRLQTLHDNKMVSISGMITDDGKKTFLYKNKIKEIQCDFNDGQMKVVLIHNN